MLTRAVRVSRQHARTMDPHWCRLVQPLQHQTDCSDRYFREYEGIFRIIFYHCQNKSGLIISFGVGIPVKLASIDRAVSYLVNLNQLQDLKFDIVCDKWSVITDKSGYEISKRSPCCCWLGQWAILPQFRTSSSFAGKHFF